MQLFDCTNLGSACCCALPCAAAIAEVQEAQAKLQSFADEEKRRQQAEQLHALGPVVDKYRESLIPEEREVRDEEDFYRVSSLLCVVVVVEAPVNELLLLFTSLINPSLICSLYDACCC